MKKKIIAALTAFCMMCSFVVPTVEAAPPPVQETGHLGTVVLEEGTENRDVKFSVDHPSLVTITVSIPNAESSASANKKLTLTVYKGNTGIFRTSTATQSSENFSEYQYYIGVDKGSYVVGIAPTTKQQNEVSVTYNIRVTPKDNIELEPNGSTEEATKMDLETWYSGYINTDGASGTYEKKDVWKVYLSQGCSYDTTITNYENVKSSNLTVNDVNNEKLDLKSDISKNIDDNGNHFIRYTAPYTGWYYITLNCSTANQCEYQIKTSYIASAEMYRMYNPNSGEHFYTKEQGEKQMLMDAGWNYEGVAWIAPAMSKVPVYRVYNPVSGDHHYTTSAAEVDNCIRAGWNDEGIGWYSDDFSSVPIYRVFNPNTTSAGSHHYTVDKNEVKSLTAKYNAKTGTGGWNDEGIGWYGM